MSERFNAVLLVIGSLFMLLAAIGVLRLPDIFIRLQAATKASTLGVGCLLLGVAIHFDHLGVATRAVLVIGFFFLTAPVAAHMIARAAYATGVPLWEGSLIDELREHRRNASEPVADHSPEAATVQPADETNTP